MIPFDQTMHMQVNEIASKTGKSFEDLTDIVRWTGLTDPNKIRWMLQREYRLGYEEAKLLVRVMLESRLEGAG